MDVSVSPFASVPNPAPMPEVACVSETESGINDLLPRIESALESACRFDPGCPDRLAAAIRYALLAPGKRLRPALVLMGAEACGGPTGLSSSAMAGAVAVEMIHAYSLVHDDLPAMDDDDLRRGRPTLHRQFDESTAILAGDAMLAQAFSHLASHVSDPAMAVEAVNVLSRAAGPSQLVGGQFDDLAAESDGHERSDVASLEHLESIHRRKTGALISASIDLGAVLSGGTADQRAILTDYARDVGLAFQIVDDLLDFTASIESLGKRSGKDASRGKLTYPGLLGLDPAREKAEQLVESAKEKVSVFDSAGSRLRWLAGYVLERTH